MVDDPLDVREMTTSDVVAVVQLWRDAGLTRPWNDPVADAELALESASSTVLLACLKGVLVGSVMVGFDGHRGWVYYLAVAETHRGRGFGEGLMRAAEHWLIDRRSPKLQLMVRSDNSATMGFYKAIGYNQEPVIVLSKRF